ncbi:MAG: phosphoribosylformylglycinamidine synthase subunit PurS [Deltaproteobacteria bacterium]|uniref:Phosphoribosylformylglycinamidine synthase subunit PurL n=1 Tax=Candidatus Zymogenus saltonus TaxID=2844893 RepID=A0A9D8KFI6_9DELT|nr:phosphoribosylformylglycinamidine synthase subunit PurS [Candidatus Zymogenus saltonus]
MERRAHRIEVGLRRRFKDALGDKMKKRIAEDLKIDVDSVKTINVYTIDADFKDSELTKIAENLLVDPIVETYSIDSPLGALWGEFDFAVEVSYLPGVTDNVGRTATEGIKLIFPGSLGKKEKAYSSVQYLISGKIDKDDAETIAKKLLGNGLIQRFTILDEGNFKKSDGILPYVPKVTGAHTNEVRGVKLDVSDDELMKISREGVLALSLEEMKEIQSYVHDNKVVAGRERAGLGNMVTDVELEALAQTWSEHCKHKIFNADIDYVDDGKTEKITSLFDTYIKGATKKIRKKKGRKDFCLSVFVDNAGVISFNEDHNLVFKVETHNSPSALDPYGGALTGIVGVNRDPFGTGMGARLIFNTDVFCFADPNFKGDIPPRLLHPKRVYEGVREGVEHGGNKSGIPTVNGTIVFDDRFLGKPLVYCGTGGIMPKKVGNRPSHKKRARVGDKIVMTGGRIGADGIHGATFSSEELHEGSPATAVQIGDPITQKRMTDMLLVARDLGLYNAITDNGAGGLSSSVGEMARDTGGCILHLERAPLKYEGLRPWEILLSEAQERMTLAVPPDKLDSFLDLAERMDVEATVLGEYTDSGKFHILFEGKTAAYLDMDFLHEGNPKMKLTAKWTPPKHPEPGESDLPLPEDLNDALLKLLGRLNVASKESVVRQYDHEVQGTSVIKPLVGIKDDGPSDAAVLTPVLGKREGVVVSSGICPKFSDIDTYRMAKIAVDEAVRNAVAVGGNIDYMAGLDNFCWCDPVKSEKTPDGEHKLAQLVRANRGLYDITTHYGIPMISGKDSMKNDYMIGETKISIPPTILFSIIGRIDDVTRCVTMDVKSGGDLVYVLGITKEEMGGSEYFAHHGFIGNSVPTVDERSNLLLYRALYKAIRARLVRSCHDVSDAGLGAALAESAFSGELGMEIDLKSVPREGVTRDDYLLFSESQGRFVVTVRPKDASSFERVVKKSGFARVGIVTEEKRLVITGLSGKVVVNIEIGKLKEAWQKPLMF